MIQSLEFESESESIQEKLSFSNTGYTIPLRRENELINYYPDFLGNSYPAHALAWTHSLFAHHLIVIYNNY